MRLPPELIDIVIQYSIEINIVWKKIEDCRRYFRLLWSKVMDERITLPLEKQFVCSYIYVNSLRNEYLPDSNLVLKYYLNTVLTRDERRILNFEFSNTDTDW